MSAIIPLLGTAAAAAAVAFEVYKKVRRDRILAEQYKQIRDAAAKLSVTSKRPVTVLVLGFQNHGRSSFVNTMFRVLYKEEGPLVMRAETGPTKNTTTTHRVLRVKNTLLRNPKYLMDIIDTPGFSTSENIDENAIRNVLRGGQGGIQNNASEVGNISQQRNVQAVPECVILVMKAEDSYMGGPALDRLPDLVKVIRDEGLQFVVVLTHKKDVQKKSIDLRVLTKSVALKAGTDFVHCVENYVIDHREGKNGSTVIANDFDTHNQTLNVVRQCYEYVKQRRQAKPQKGSRARGGAVDDQDRFYDSASD